MTDLNQSEYLTPEEVRQLTGTSFKANQKRALDKMGYPYETTPKGAPLVSRFYARNRACGIAVAAAHGGPRLELVR